MGATKSTDWGFQPKVWNDHIDAYYDRKLVYGAFADKDTTLQSQPGDTVTFPYFKTIGDAEEPAEDESISVDKLQDSSFSATVKEVAKAVGIKRAAIRKGGMRRERAIQAAQQGIARVHAEKVDKDLLTEMNTNGNYVTGYVATADTHVANVTNIATGKVMGFGDKHKDAVAIFLHSYHVLSLLTDTTSGFLKADANSPFFSVPGFQGSLLGMAVIEVDTLPRGADFSGKQSYYSFMIKAMPYGILQAEEMDLEDDYDILAREYVVASTQWYAVKAFHAKVSTADLRISRSLFATGVAA